MTHKKFMYSACIMYITEKLFQKHFGEILNNLVQLFKKMSSPIKLDFLISISPILQASEGVMISCKIT